MTALAQPVTDYRLLLLLENYALSTEGATISASSVATSSAGSLSAAGAINPNLDTAWRSDALLRARPQGAAAVETVTIALGSPRAVDAVAIAATNNRLPWRVRFRKAAGSAAVYESPWHAAIVRGTMGEWTWPDMPWQLGPDERDLERWGAEFDLRAIILADQVYYGVSVVEIDFDSSSQQHRDLMPDYLQVGLVWASRSFRPRTNILPDWEVSVDDLSVTHRGDGGGLGGREGPRLTSFAFTIEHADRDEAYRVIHPFLVRHGKLGRVFAWMEPHRRADFRALSGVGTLETLPAIYAANLDWPAARSWVFKETR